LLVAFEFTYDVKQNYEMSLPDALMQLSALTKQNMKKIVVITDEQNVYSTNVMYI